MLGIRDIFGADPDPRIRTYLSLTDPTPFFSDFKDARNNFFFIFFYNLIAGKLSSPLKNLIFLQKFVLKFYFASTKNFFSPLNTFYEKREGSGSVSLTNGSGSERSKNMRIRIRIPTLVEHNVRKRMFLCFLVFFQMAVTFAVGTPSVSGQLLGLTTSGGRPVALMASDKRPSAGHHTNSPAGQPTNSPAGGQLTNSPAGQLTNSPAGQLTNSPAGLPLSYLTSGADAGGVTQSPSSAVQLTGLMSSGQMNSFPPLSSIQMASPVSSLQLPGGANSFYNFQLPYTNSSSSLSDFQLTGNSSSSHSNIQLLGGGSSSSSLSNIQLTGNASSSHSNIQLLGGGSSSSLSNIQLTGNSTSSNSNIQLTLGSSSSLSNLQLSDSSTPSFTNIQFPPGTVITLDTGQVLDWSQVSRE